MYFKPRIFISSTLDLAPIRKEIREFLESVGAEVMLYEENLTPSIKSSVYRQDILEADFIIFLFNEKYGSRTNSGKSGTHEEWEVALNSDIPKHVYIRQNIKLKRTDSLQKFIIKEISNKSISFFYYSDNEKLIKQIKSTVFTIARDIALNKVGIKYISKERILQLSILKDFESGLHLIRSFEELQEKCSRLEISFIETTIITDFFNPFFYSFEADPDIIIDIFLNSYYKDIFKSFKKFNLVHSKVFVSSGYYMKTLVLDRNSTEISYKELKQISGTDLKSVNKLFNDLISSYNLFKENLFERKTYLETKYKI
ncbi:DUF4062 domain-containing protein [Leptospira interrogans]|uniref:DUF4062 domain-containing protein n=1 Tax=Leptospira interrogans serovar Bataviae TaxID=312175 RepID=A0AAP9WNH8_LEPIR|nr:DUF4062 domain-containing protein [Leptospira interrogans]QOI53008.1 DUF4062 domain-containing protein [Leptospira interrogans serovar Bataviae]